MHDPNTVAFDIKYPWGQWSKLGHYFHRESFITIWHRDPESDGSDDSCGWFTPKLNKKEIGEIEKAALFELQYWFNETPFGLVPKVSAEAVVYQAFAAIAWRVFRKRLSTKHLIDIMSLTYNHVDNFADGFRRPKLDADEVVRSCYFIARSFKRMERPWWRHPRFHLWHYRIQLHPWRKFYRWAFERCSVCRRGFAWGYCPIGNWEGSAVWHHECDRHLGPPAKSEPATT